MSDLEHKQLPKNIVVTDDGAFRYYWRKWVPAFMWASLGLTLTGVGIATITNYFPLDLLCSLVLYLIPGPLLLYIATGLLVNYTEFRIEDGRLLIRHMPIPWRGNKSIPVMDVRRFLVFTRREESGEASEGPLTCDVGVIKNGDIIIVASGANLEIATAIVREGQRILGKPNQLDTEKLDAVFKQDRIRINTLAAKNIPFMILIFLGSGIFLIYNGMNIPGIIMVAVGLAGIPIALRTKKTKHQGP